MSDERVIETIAPRWYEAGPPYEMTREELLDALHKMGFSMSERQLKSWVTYGILPRPPRRLPRGATDGIPRALYPEWMQFVLGALLQEVTRGATIDDLKRIAPNIIREWQERAETSSPVLPPGSAVATANLLKTTSTVLPATAVGHAPIGKGPIVPQVSRALQRAAWNYAAQFTEKNATPVTEASLTLRTDDGAEVRVVINPITPND